MMARWLGCSKAQRDADETEFRVGGSIELRLKEGLIKSRVRDRSAFAPRVYRVPTRSEHSSAQKHFGPSKEKKIGRVAPAAASAALCALPRYLPPRYLLGCDATPCSHLHLAQRASRHL